MRKLLDVVFVLVRLPLILLLLPFGFLAALLKTLGEWGEWLDDACHSASRAITWALNPRAWEKAKEMAERNRVLESTVKFYESSRMPGATAAETSTTPDARR